MSDLPSWGWGGQKVVYVRESKAPFLENQPIIGNIYTIRGVNYGSDGRLGLHLVEVVNQARYCQSGMLEPGFMISRFRPLITKTIEDDLAIFAPLLKTTKEEEFVE